MDVSEAKRLKQLEEENAKLKRIVADQTLDIAMLKDVLGKNVWSGPRCQEKVYDD
jgi:putative transposase